MGLQSRWIPGAASIVVFHTIRILVIWTEMGLREKGMKVKPTGKVEGGVIMGVMRCVYYTVCCNRCYCKMEDWSGDVSSYVRTRGHAEDIAREEGFLQIGKNTWLCPECREKEEK